MRRVITLLTFIALAISLLFGLNYAVLHRHMSAVLSSDARNSGLSFYVHYQLLVNPRVVVVDLRSVSDSNSPADVFRVLLQFAERKHMSEYEKIVLAWRGEPKFVLEGSYFQKLGAEYGQQNMAFTVRTFPENVYLPDGTAAFGRWTGGLLGVFGKQLEDFNEFHRRWYINDLSRSRE